MIDTTTEISQVLVDGVEIPLANSGGGSVDESMIKMIEGTTGDIVIPEGVTKLRQNLFYMYPFEINSVKLPNSLQVLGRQCFSFAPLKTIELPNSLTIIEWEAFRESSLESITIPESVSMIEASAFVDCKSLKNVVLKNGAYTYIQPSTFQGCSALENIIIPENIEVIDNSAFLYCNNLAIITMLSATPPTIYSNDAFSTATKIIYVPIGTKETYKTSPIWSDLPVVYLDGTEQPVTYSFVTNGGSSVEPITAVLLETLPISTPDDTDMGLLGWYTDAEFTNKISAPYYSETDVTLYAKYGFDGSTIARAIPINQSDIGVTTFEFRAEPDYEIPPADSGIGEWASQWYKFTPTETGTYNIIINMPMGGDAYVYIASYYDGTLHSYRAIDDEGGSETFELTAGTMYYFGITRYNMTSDPQAISGTFMINKVG